MSASSGSGSGLTAQCSRVAACCGLTLLGGGGTQAKPGDRTTHRPHSHSFWGLPYRVLNMKPKTELLWDLWVDIAQG